MAATLVSGPISISIDVIIKLSNPLIQEIAGIGEAASHAEWIGKELRSMQGFLEQVERRRYGQKEDDDLNAWAQKLEKIAGEAKEVIETFVKRSAKGRGRGILYWFDKYRVGKELLQIRKKMSDISQERINLSTTHGDVSVEIPGAWSSMTLLAPAMETLNRFLFLIDGDEMMEMVEGVKYELGYLQNIASNLRASNLRASTSERENVWLREVKEVCSDASKVAGKFIYRAERWLKLDRLRKGLYVHEGYASAREFEQEMKLIRTQIGDALRRKFTYGVGGNHMGVGVKQTAQRTTPVPNMPTTTISELYYWAQNLWASMDRNFKCTQRDLALMSAFLSDTESAEGLNERQQVWASQLRLVAQNGRSLVAACTKVRYFNYLSRMKFARDINGLLKEIINISDRKSNYGIADIEGRIEPPVSLGPSSEEIMEINASGSSGAGEHPAAFSSSYWAASGLKQEVQSIREERDLMDALFRDVQDTEELDRGIWLEQMRRIFPLVESVINDYDTILEHKPILTDILKYSIRKIRTRRVIWKKIDEIRHGIEDASRRRKIYGMDQFQSRAMVQILRGRTQPSLIREESDIVGFDDDAQVLMSQLLSDEKRRCITCIVGIHGVGKTKLAELIYEDKAVVDHFERRVWVSVSPNGDNAQQVIEQIANQIMGDGPWTTAELCTQHHLLQTLACEKYLIVVDGVETCQLYLDDLKTAIPDMSTASRLVLTTRNYSEAAAQEYSDTTFVHPLQLLDDESSWVLFQRHLKVVDNNIPPELIQVGREIMMKCGGLPLEIVNMSGLLSCKNVSLKEWSGVLRQLNEDQQRWLETRHTINTDIPLYLRRCLEYFLLFPAEFEIPVRRLVVLWVAEDLVHSAEEGGVPPELVAERYLTELIDRDLIQATKRKLNGKVKACRLPSPLRQLLLTTKSRFLQVRVADRLDKNDIWHDHIHDDATTRYNSASLKKAYGDALSFLSFDFKEGSKPGEQIGNFLKGCIESNCFLLLRVLDLERVYRPTLPKNIAKLSRLRYLGLRWTYLESLPSFIGSLLKLQILDLKHTYIYTLPTSIWQMYLRHLFLSETFRTKFPPQTANVNNLSDLQTLWGLFVDEETPLKGGLDTLVNITRLGLACQSMSPEKEESAKEDGKPSMKEQLEAIADWIMKLEHLQSLTLKSRKENGEPSILHLNSFQNNINLTDMYLLGSLSSSSVLSQFPPTLVELTLSHSKLEDDPMQILKNFQNLRILSLLAESYNGKTMSCESKSFPQLHILKLWKLENLEEWNIEEEALPSLRQLEIRSCPCMTMLPDGLQHVNTLLELKLTDMPILVDDHMRQHQIPSKCTVVSVALMNGRITGIQQA